MLEPSLLPHRPPFSLLDRLVHADLPSGRVVAERRVTASDALWPARAPDPAAASCGGGRDGTLPPVIVIEALCQAAACYSGLLRASDRDRQPGTVHHGYLVGAVDFRFPSLVQVGETLVLEVTRKESLGALVAFSAQAFAVTPACAVSLNSTDTSNSPDPADPARPATTAPPETAPGDRPMSVSRREVASGRLLFAVTD